MVRGCVPGVPSCIASPALVHSGENTVKFRHGRGTICDMRAGEASMVNASTKLSFILKSVGSLVDQETRGPELVLIC